MSSWLITHPGFQNPASISLKTLQLPYPGEVVSFHNHKKEEQVGAGDYSPGRIILELPKLREKKAMEQNSFSW